jgi:hypothetical protein
MFDCHNETMLDFMNQCEQMFMNITHAYWDRIMVETQYKRLTGMRR